MADYRQVHTKIWDDPWFVDLEPLERLCFLWLITNHSASVSGLYEFSVGRAAREIGSSRKVVQSALNKFIETDKIMIEGDFIWIKNLRKYNDSGSPNAYKRIMIDYELLPDGPMKRAYAAHYKHEDVKRQPTDSPLPTPTKPLPNPSMNREHGIENIEHRIPNTEHTLTNLSLAPEGAEKEFEDQSPIQIDELALYHQDTREWVGSFVDITGIHPRSADRTKWERDARDCIRVGITADHIRAAVEYMRDPERKYKISGPGSVFKIAQNVGAEETSHDGYKKYLEGEYARFIEH